MDSPPNSCTSRAVFWDKTIKRGDCHRDIHARHSTSSWRLKRSPPFFGRRPDEAAFDAMDKQCVFLEFTRLMDSVRSSDEGDWAERKELEKRMRDTECTFTLSIILASSVGDPEIARKPTSRLEHGALSRGSKSKTDSAFLGWQTPSQRQNMSAYSVKNASPIGHYPQAFSRLCSSQPWMGSQLAPNWTGQFPNVSLPTLQKNSPAHLVGW